MATFKKQGGHADDTQAADNQLGLSGQIARPLKLTMLGAGSGFTSRLVNDIFLIPGADRGEVALVDIDRQRLTTMYQVVKKLAEKHGKTGWTITATTQRREVLRGTDYLVSCIEVSGTQCVRHDNDIPARYGVDQCIGDTIGPGGLFKGLRTIPVWLEVLRDAEELCPNAIVLNYTNPMNMMCLASGRASRMAVFGCCHGIQGTSHLLAQRAGVPYNELDWECAGINHLAWFTKLEHKGRNLYPKLMRLARSDIDRALRQGPARRYKRLGFSRWELRGDWEHDLIRKDMMLHFGAFMTEGSGHFSEYIPYYRKRADLLRKYARPGYNGGSSFYADNWPKWRAAADKLRLQMVRGKAPLGWLRSWEYASWIIEAREKDSPVRVHLNVMNQHKGGGPLISNLMPDGCVEVACLVNRNGIQPTVYGRLPANMAALCESNMRMFDLGADAAIHKSIELAIQALTLDPLTAACCSPAEIKEMTLKLFAAEKQFLKGYR